MTNDKLEKIKSDAEQSYLNAEQIEVLRDADTGGNLDDAMANGFAIADAYNAAVILDFVNEVTDFKKALGEVSDILRPACINPRNYDHEFICAVAASIDEAHSVIQYALMGRE